LDLFQRRHNIVSLEQADLSGAKLRRAYLGGAYLLYALLGEADLSLAILSAANLKGADLTEANLSVADLSAARGWTEEKLRTASSLEGAIMPDRQTLRDDKTPNGPTFADWLKYNEDRLKVRGLAQREG
jgi:uncharacterized protein YjbI with pentapeptide repeats